MEFYVCTFAALFTVIGYTQGYPLHASCKIQWNGVVKMGFYMYALAAFLTATFTGYTHAYPTHASCKIQWKFPSVACRDFSNKMVAQATTWASEDNCAKGGEKCLYKLSATSATTLKGTHTTPQKHYVDDLTFELKSDGGSGCDVQANSRSETWYAYLDYSTNYCNLRNLIDGAGLNTTTGFEETTSDDVCTQYSSKNCEKY